MARGRDFPRASILPGVFDGGERARKVQGCRVMGFDGISHDCNTPGSPDQRGNHPIRDSQKGWAVGTGVLPWSNTPEPQRG